MGVCYRPHSQPPYRALNLQLVSGRAVAVLGAASDGLSSSPAARPLHQLHQVKDLTNTAGHRQTPSHKFCTDISMDDSSIFQVHTIKEGRARYSAMLHVSIDSQRPFPGLDLRLPVSCIGAAPMRPITVHNRSIGSSRDDNMLNGIGSALSLDLRVVDPSTGIELHHLPEDDLVKLDVSLVDPKGNYREIQPLECSISFNKNIHSVAMSNSSKIIFSRCSIAINFQPEQRPMQWYPSPPGIHHHTTPFRLGPRLLHKNSSAPAAVFFQCLVLLCRHESLCLSHEFCSQPHRKSNRPASFSQGLRAADQDRFLLLYRTVRLDLQKIDPRSRNDGSNGDNNFIDSFNSHNDEVKRCRYSLCLTRVQAVMTSLLMTLLLLLVIVLVLILYRRHRAIYKLAYKTPPGPGSGLQRCQQQHTANNHNTSSVTRSSSLAGSPPQPHFYSKFNMASLSPPTLLSSSHHTGPPHSVLSYISDSQPSSSAAEHNPYCHKLYLLSTQDSATAQDQPDTNKLSSTTTTTNNNNLFFQLSEDSSEDVSPPARFSSLCPPRSTYQYDRSSAPLHLELGQYQRFSSYYDTLPKYQTVHPSTASTATFADQHHTIAATASNTGRIPVHTTTNNISSTQTATSTAPNLSGYSNIVCSLQSSIINERNNTNVML